VRQLQFAGFLTTVANHGGECLEVLESSLSPIDIVLLDIEMPVMDGFQAASEIRIRETNRNLPHLPVIAVTGNARMEQIERGQFPKALGFLTISSVRGIRSCYYEAVFQEGVDS